MELNDIGKMVTEAWRQLPDSFEGITLDVFQVMPDHMHGILFLGTNPEIPADHALGDVVRYFKGRSTTRYFAEVRRDTWPRVDGQLWQRRFNDRIIRSNAEMGHIRRYIEGNPSRWWERHNGE